VAVADAAQNQPEVLHARASFCGNTTLSSPGSAEAPVLDRSLDTGRAQKTETFSQGAQ